MKRIVWIICAIIGLCVGEIYAQKVSNYSGIVTEVDGMELIGVTVLNTKTKQGTITDFDGKYSIKGSKGDILEFGYLGFKTKSITLSSKTTENVELEVEAQEIDEVIVTGYMDQKRSDISTAITSVNVDALGKSGSASVLESMQGQISGLQIISDDGSPAGNVTFRLRGTNSLTGGTQPLFVIDGVAQPITDSDDGSNPLAGLNPNDIASMEVLKDAAAAAIYGAEGSNGVVIITTKTGQAGKLKVNISASTGFNFVPKNPMELLSPEEYARRRYSENTDNASWQKIVEEEYWNDPSKYVNWVDEITQPSQRHELSTSFSGGGKTTTYLMSVGYQDNQGLIILNDYKRLSARINLNQKVSTNGSITGNFSYSSTIEKNPMQDGLYRKALLTDPFLFSRTATEQEIEQGNENINYRDPTVNITNGDVRKATESISGNLRFQYKLWKDLTFNTQISAMTKKNDSYQVMDEFTTIGRYSDGKITVGEGQALNWAYLAQLTYNKLMAKKHKLGAFVAFESRYDNSEYYSQIGTNFVDLDLGKFSLKNAQNIQPPVYNFSDNTSLSYLGRITYDYKSRYVVNASLRLDGSSKFGSNNKYALFPAVSAAWRVEQEDFMKDVDFLASWKLRASYGETGNKQIPSYTSLPLLNYDYVNFGGSNETSASLLRLANEGLKWETSKEFNVGTDISFFNSRLSFTGDFYRKRISDMLLEVVLPQASGFNTAWKNAGEMQNLGWEFSASATPFLTRNFRWSTNFNISFNKNKVISLDKGQYEQFYSSGADFGNDVLLRVGNPVGIYYGYIEDGVYNNQEELDNSADDPNKALGRTKIIDTNNDGVIDQYDRVPIANVTPIHYGGWGNTFAYKGLELYVFLRWSYGNDQINANLQAMGNAGSLNTNCMKDAYYHAWTEDNPMNDYRNRYEVNDPYKTYLTSRYVEDGSFLSLSTVQLSYRIPSELIKRFKLTNLQINLRGSNLAMWTNYTGFNPEANNGKGTAKKIAPALDNSAYPRPITALLSLDIGF